MHPLRFFGLVIIVLLMTALTPFSPMGTPSVRIVHATTRTVSLVGYYSTGWNNTPANPTITITEGDALVITTSSGDTFQHHFFVDIDELGMTPNCSVDKCASIIPPTATDTLTGFTMGTYTYYCEYHSAMKGTFIVQPPPDFSITSNPSSLNLNQGTFQTSTLTISSLNGFSGTVTLSPPSVPTGITATLNSSTVTLAAGSSKAVAINVTIGASTTPGSYTVSVTSSRGGNSHTANVSITVVGPDFSISLDQTSQSIVVGSSGNATVTLTSQNGFAGTVNLAATTSPSGPAASLAPAMVSLTSGGSATSKLTITTSSSLYSSTSPGSYTVIVTGTGSPSLSHPASLSITVTSPSLPAQGIPASTLIIAGVALAAIIVVAVFVLRRRPGK